MDILLLVLQFAILIGILAIANIAVRQPWARYATYLTVLGANSLLALNGMGYLAFTIIKRSTPEPGVVMAVLPLERLTEYGQPIMTLPQVIGGLLVSMLMVGVASALLIPRVRRWLAGVEVRVPVFDYAPESTPSLTVKLAPIRLLPPVFDPDSALHMVGLVLSVYLVGQSVLSFVLSDVAELADLISSTSIVDTAVIQALLIYVAAAAGVGYLIRRGWRATLKRLGLVWPTWKQLLIAIGVASALIVLQFAVVLIWELLVGAESVAEQMEAAEALTSAINTIGIAFLIAFTSATSEEIVFRGAMQPALGVGLTAIVFTMMHFQYALTPATLLILVLALVLGFLRKYTNTTTAILCHFCYNFISMSFAVLAQEALEAIESNPEAAALVYRLPAALLRALGGTS